MKNPGLMALIFFLVGMLLMWSGVKGRNPIRVVKDVLTNGVVGQWSEYKPGAALPGGISGAAPPTPGAPPLKPGTHA